MVKTVCDICDGFIDGSPQAYEFRLRGKEIMFIVTPRIRHSDSQANTRADVCKRCVANELTQMLTAITPYNTVVYMTDGTASPIYPIAVTISVFQAKCLCEALNRLYPNYKRANYIVWEPTW